MSRERPRRVGILTSGGDAPGMNAAIRAITRFERVVLIAPDSNAVEERLNDAGMPADRVLLVELLRGVVDLEAGVAARHERVGERSLQEGDVLARGRRRLRA